MPAAVCAGRRALMALVLLWLQWPGAAAQEAPAEQRGKVEAAFLRNFARYVTWPPAAFATERSPWRVCILGGQQFDTALEKTFLGRTEQGRPFEVVRAGGPEQLPGCQIVFVGYDDPAQRRAVLDDLRKRPILTVGNAREFLSEGGIIRLLAGDHIEMSINLDQARAASLSIPSKMLEVAHDIVENGVVRRWR